MTWRSATSALLAVSACVVAHAQDDGAGPARAGLSVTPRVGVSQTVTDNNNLRSTSKDAALITVVSPGISIASRAGRVQGTLDYALNGVLYTKSDQKSELLQTLSAQGSAELIERVFYLDARASIGQQATSAFGTQSVDYTVGNPNRTEVASLTVSPYLRGRIGNLASLELRGNAAETNAKDSINGDSRIVGGSLRVDGLNSGKLRWFALASTQKSTFKFNNAENSTSLLNLGLRYRPDVDFDFGVNAGPERNDYGGQGSRNSNNYGVSATWTPSPRTKVLGDYQYHDYGNSHTLAIEHRMAQSSFRYSDTQNVALGDQNGGLGARTNYELLSLMFAYITDPAERDARVKAMLQQLGLSADAVLTNGFLASAPSLSRRQELSLAMNGVRTTVTFSLGQTKTSRLAPVASGGGDLSQSARVLMRGASVSVAYRLTPTAGISVTLSEQQTRGDTASFASNLHSVIANWTGRLGDRTSVSLGARHSTFDSATTPYRENAVFANLVQQF